MKKVSNGSAYIRYGMLSIPAVNPYSWWKILQKSAFEKSKYPKFPETSKVEILLEKIRKKIIEEFVHRLGGRELILFYNEDSIVWQTGDDAKKEEYWILQIGDLAPSIEWEDIK